MTDKCVNTGNWIEMCEFLSEVTRNQYGDIQGLTMSRRDLVIAGDYVVIEDENHIDYGKIYQIKDDDIGSHWIKLIAMRHATDAEIKAGKRLEVNQ